MDDGSIDLWSTHLPVLAACVANTQGPVLELGCGHYSTRLLHVLCRDRELVTIDTNSKWTEKFAYLACERMVAGNRFCPTHHIITAPNIAEFLTEKDDNLRVFWDLPSHWSVVFEDSGRAQLRPDNIAAVRDHADLIIVNNTEPGLNGEPFRPVYRYETIIPTFPYRWDYTVYPVWTSVLSDRPLPDWLERLFG